MAAPFRITRPPIVKGAFGQGEPEDSSTPMQAYMKRLVLLIPAEVVSLYLVGIGIIPPDVKIAFAVWALVCLILVVIVRAYGTADQANKVPPQWSAVIVSSVSFVIWVYMMPGPFQVYGLAVPFVGSLAILVWTFVVPYIYKG